MQRVTIYHSWEWATLVETGWITLYVDYVNGVYMATMLYQPRYWR